MGTKLEPGKFDCHAAAAPDEPTFTLLARDPHAARLVDSWANLRADAIMYGKAPQSDWAKVNEARQCAQAMAAWREKHRG